MTRNTTPPTAIEKAHDLQARRAEVLEVAKFIYAARVQHTAGYDSETDTHEAVNEAIALMEAVDEIVVET